MTDRTPLPTRPLGTTGMEITRVGLGAWAIGGGDWQFGWGRQDDNDSVAAIRHAVARGINWIDTAAVYGLGHSEDVVARALKGLPAAERPFVFTKCGMVWDEADRSRAPQRLASPASIRKELDGSLRRLGVERIDLYQLHWPPEDGTPLDEYWGAMLELKREGKIRAAGLSNHKADQLVAAEKLGHVDSLQPPFSAVRRDVAERELPWCAEHRTGVIVYSPMLSGLLSGAFTRERAAALPKNDWRSRAVNFQGEALERNLALVDTLRTVAARHDTGVGSVAIAWTLAWRGVTGAIVGARNPAQVDGWLEAGSLELTPADLQEIGDAIKTTGAGSGPVAEPVR
ncbi:MAG TPA: aldo/keto reductase [Gemmatimonadales bacterium]|nr:aldo/keto reductase [Gemmatimonadales bacterium]